MKDTQMQTKTAPAKIQLSKTQWFIVLWLGGFLALALIAGAFRLMVQMAYQL